MTSETPNTPGTDAAQPNRYPAKPEHLPEPTYWPFFLALGAAFIGWGLISFWLVSIGGLIVFAIALRGWINNLRHDK